MLNTPNKLTFSLKRTVVNRSITGRINNNKRMAVNGFRTKYRMRHSNNRKPIFIDIGSGVDKNKPTILIVSRL